MSPTQIPDFNGFTINLFQDEESDWIANSLLGVTTYYIRAG